MKVQVYSSVDALPPRVAAFAEASARDDFFRGLTWFRTMLRTATPSGDEVRIFVAERVDRPVAMLIAGERRGAGRLKTHMLLGAGHGMYVATYAPFLDPEHGVAGLRAIAASLAAASPPFDVMRFDGLDPATAEFAALFRALRRAGFLVQRFFNFDNPFEDVRGVSSGQYLARRPAHLREMARGDGPQPAWSDTARIVQVPCGGEVTRALIDYALVDVQSTSPPEAYPNCTPELARAAASHAALRFGLLYLDDEPAAAQLWVVGGGRATLWRRRCAGRFARLPVEAMLTLAMLRHCFDNGPLNEIEFSRDASEGASDWLAGSRPRVGLLAANPRTVKGALAAARHIGGHLARSAVRRLRSGGAGR